MFMIRKSSDIKEKEFINKIFPAAPTLYALNEKIKYHESTGYTLKGEIKQGLNTWYACMMVKTIKLNNE